MNPSPGKLMCLWNQGRHLLIGMPIPVQKKGQHQTNQIERDIRKKTTTNNTNIFSTINHSNCTKSLHAKSLGTVLMSFCQNKSTVHFQKKDIRPSTMIGSAAVGNKIAIATIAINKMDTDSATCHQKTKLKYSDISILYKEVGKKSAVLRSVISKVSKILICIFVIFLDPKLMEWPYQIK